MMEKENERLFRAREEPGMDQGEEKAFRAREKDAAKYAASKLRFDRPERKAGNNRETKAGPSGQPEKKRSSGNRYRSNENVYRSRQEKRTSRTGSDRAAEKSPKQVYSRKLRERRRIGKRALRSAGETADRVTPEDIFQDTDGDAGQDASERTVDLTEKAAGDVLSAGAQSLRGGRYRRMFLAGDRLEETFRDMGDKVVFRDEGPCVFSGSGKAGSAFRRKGTAEGSFFRKEDISGTGSSSNPLSKWLQKKRTQKASYERSRRSLMEAAGGGIAGTVRRTGERFSARNILEGIRKTGGVIVTAGFVLFMLFVIISMLFTSCTSMVETGAGVIMSASFTAEDADLTAVEERYRAMEAALRRELEDLAERFPGYDVYRIEGGEVGHNAYELAALLTVLYEDYTEEEVLPILESIFDAQYEVTYRTSSETETRTRTVRVGESLGEVVTSGYCNCAICCGPWAGGATASGVMPQADHTIAVDKYDPLLPFGTHVIMNGVEYVVEDTGPLSQYGVTFDVYYDDHTTAQAHGHQTWEAFLADDNGSGSVEITETVTERILTAAVKNEGITAVMQGLHLTELQEARYGLLLDTNGNREGVFPPDIYSDFNEGSYAGYQVPAEALSDTAFAGMLREAERYLGLPYVWGGSSPETGFDCSGFVSWVINHSGNGWNVGRQTAEGLRQACSYVPPSEARPGDLVFFRGTYDTVGASHVGIYVGNGKMLHCGHPVQYASIDTDYWRAHFYQYGRIG